MKDLKIETVEDLVKTKQHIQSMNNIVSVEDLRNKKKRGKKATQNMGQHIHKNCIRKANDIIVYSEVMKIEIMEQVYEE